MRIIVFGLAGAVTIALCLASAGVASAADWHTQPVPVVPNAFLNAVSCASATACTSVGLISNPPGNQPTLAEGWNGISWLLQPTPSPAGATTSVLLGVSCTSPTACIAVGYYSTNIYHSAGGTLAERWNGVSWSIQPTPNPAGAATSALSGVSCTSPTACIAVGVSTTSPGQYATLAERWNGVDWSILPTPSPTALIGAPLSGSLLSAVSCTSPTACTAVGDSYNSSLNEVPLAERWNGASWSIETTPDLAGKGSGLLDGVSCASPAMCTAVGAQGDGRARTLAEQWNGVDWSIQPTPNPIGQVAFLSGVSCPSSSVCSAVGYFVNNAGTVFNTLAERRDGDRWLLQTTPSLDNSELLGVSCTSISTCTAVGYNNSVALAERY